MDLAAITAVIVGLAAGVAVLGFTIVGLIMVSGPVGRDYLMERRGMLGSMFGGLVIIAGAAWIVGLFIAGG